MAQKEGSPAGGGRRSQIIIPARLASTRLPRKLLLRETGKTVLQHTYESARRRANRRGSASRQTTKKSRPKSGVSVGRCS